MSTHYVYRCFDADGRLLYIGSTGDVGGRINQHKSPCYHRDVASRHLAARMASWVAEQHPSREAARAAEAVAIEAEAPLLNVMHNKGRHDHSWPEVDPTQKTALEAALARFA